MSPDAENLCEQIDAALFSSDMFFTQANVDEFKEYLARWTRRIDTINAIINE